MNTAGIGRRSALALAGAAALAGARPARAEALKLGIGTALTQEGGAVVLRMQEQKLLEAAAGEVGLPGLEGEYLGFTVLLRMLQGLAANQLQFGMIGSTPLIRTLSGQSPVVPIALAGGGNLFPLQVPKGSPIKTLEDLRGKTVLTIVASDIHLMFTRMLQAQFGTENPKDVGITLRGINALTELSRAQSGIDAVVSMEPISEAAERSGELVTLVRNDGSTGDAYDGPEGKGAGHTVACFAKTPFAPDAFYPHRVWWVVRPDFLAANPKAVQAFLMAEARATADLATMPVRQVVETYGREFPAEVEDRIKHMDHVLWRSRGWGWITQSDVNTLAGLSQTKALFPTALDPAAVRKTVASGAAVCKAAWEATGSKPPRAAFDDRQPKDPRGKPSWEIAA